MSEASGVARPVHSPDAALPGYRRRIRIEPGAGHVRAALEDDFHCMVVTLVHDGERVATVSAKMLRAPWSTCPGAEAQLAATFAGQPLDQVTARREKKRNCTHLHDLAVLAAAHAGDAAGCIYDVRVSDPVEGERTLVLRRDGTTLLCWVERDGVLAAPEAIVGLTLATLREWIAGLPRSEQEPARLLQWASLVAHGRTVPIEQQSDATALPPSCYTFQPERAAVAERIGAIHDFSREARQPLEAIGEIC